MCNIFLYFIYLFIRGLILCIHIIYKYIAKNCELITEMQEPCIAANNYV